MEPNGFFHFGLPIGTDCPPTYLRLREENLIPWRRRGWQEKAFNINVRRG